MGTAVLHPQDYLAAPRRDQNSHPFPLAEYLFPVASSNGGVFLPLCEASTPVMGHGRDAALSSKIYNRGGSILSRNNSAVGLLPSPGQARPSAHNTHRRLVPRNSACGFPDIAGSKYGKKHSIPSHLSSHGSEVLISRQLSVPMLDHVARVQRLTSERFPLHAAQLHERKPRQRDARLPSNLAQSMSSCAGGTANSRQKLKFSASSHFPDLLCLKRADSFDPSAHCRKRLHPEVPQVEAYLDKQCAKPPLKDLPDGPGRFICTNMSIAGNKFSVNKQLNRSVSDKVWERSETPNLHMPAHKAGKKMATSLSDGIVEVHTGKSGSAGKSELKLTSFEPPMPSLGRMKENCPQMQVYVDLDTRGRIQGANTGMVRSLRAAISGEAVGTKRHAGASLSRQVCGDMDAAMEHRDVNEEGMVVIEGYAVQGKMEVGKVGVTSTHNESAGSNIPSLETVIGSEGRSGGHSSVWDADGIWASMMNEEKWAGPSFFNSPPPSSLPVPSFTFLLSRAPSAGFKSSNSAGGFGALTVPDKSSLQASTRTWDAAFATKDLRRMLRLDNNAAVEV